MSDTTTPDITPAEQEFRDLFWAARDAQRQRGRAASPGDPEHTAAITFAQNQGWSWAENLVEASRLWALGDDDNSLALLASVRPNTPASFQSYVLYVTGASLRDNGDLDEAIKAYHKVLDDPKFDRRGHAWGNLGVVLRRQGDLDEAIKAHHKAIDDPDNDAPGYAWHNLGNVLYDKGDFDEAIEAYRKALDDRNFGAPAKAWTNLANAYKEAEKNDEARDAAQHALSSVDPTGADHARARLLLNRIDSKLKETGLSEDDRASVAAPSPTTDSEALEQRLIGKIKEASDTQYERYLERGDSRRDDVLTVLRGWSSAVTLLEGSEQRWRGGGLFLKWRGCGIVIDPGFDFLRNFHDRGFHGREINVVLVSHNHPDHNHDLKSIDDLRYELYKRLAGKTVGGGEPYVLLWDEDTSQATQFAAEQPEHHYRPIVFSTGFPQPIDLNHHQCEQPLRITPFKVEHGGDVPCAMGFVLELLDEKGEVASRIGYTGDTAYFDELPGHLQQCDVLIAHISQPSIEELQDSTKLKDAHLGYRGVIQLIKECQPKLALVGEFWAGFADLRVDLTKGIRMRSGFQHVFPAGLGLHLQLPTLDMECTQCRKYLQFSGMKVSPPSDDFGDLSYLCPACIL